MRRSGEFGQHWELKDEYKVLEDEVLNPKESEVAMETEDTSPTRTSSWATPRSHSISERKQGQIANVDRSIFPAVYDPRCVLGLTWNHIGVESEATPPESTPNDTSIPSSASGEPNEDQNEDKGKGKGKKDGKSSKTEPESTQVAPTPTRCNHRGNPF
jgi:hypothetical protein